MNAVPVPYVGAVAVTTARCVPSSTVSSIRVTGKFTLACPAGTSTVAGTVASVALLLLSATVSGLVGVGATSSVPLTEPPASPAVAGSVSVSEKFE